jgi:hypothetical protein
MYTRDSYAGSSFYSKKQDTSLSFSFLRDIFRSNIPNCQYWSSATLSPSLEIYASTMYIAGIYTLSFFSDSLVLLTDYMYIAIIISWGTLCTTRLHQSRIDSAFDSKK